MRAAQDNAQPLQGIAYTPRTDATPEAEVSALAAVYRLVLNRNAPCRTNTHGDDVTVKKSKGVSHVAQQTG